MAEVKEVQIGSYYDTQEIKLIPKEGEYVLEVEIIKQFERRNIVEAFDADGNSLGEIVKDKEYLKPITYFNKVEEQVIELTHQDLQVLEQELNPNDDYQSLVIAESAFGQELDNYEDSLYSEVEEYLLTLEERWNEEDTLTQTQKEDMLWEESYRLESDLLESEENYF